MKTIADSMGTEILIADSFSELAWEVGNLGRQILWVFDSNTALMVRPLPEPNVIIEPGEDSKRMSNVLRILDSAYDYKLEKNAVFLAFGGGVVSDITGLAASMWKFGSSFAAVPTTLLSMVDCCIGGRNGINFKGSGRLVGTYYPPVKILICPDTLRSLTKTEYANGLAQCIRLAFIAEDETLGRTLILERQDILARKPETVAKVIEQAVNVKRKYVESDPIESNGLSDALNVGNFLADALRLLTGQSFSYGKALAWGLSRSADITEQTRNCTSQFAGSITRLYQSYGFDTTYRISRGQWQELKKLLGMTTADNTIGLILPVSQGKVARIKVNEDIIREQVIENALL